MQHRTTNRAKSTDASIVQRSSHRGREASAVDEARGAIKRPDLVIGGALLALHRLAHLGTSLGRALLAHLRLAHLGTSLGGVNGRKNFSTNCPDFLQLCFLQRPKSHNLIC